MSMKITSLDIRKQEFSRSFRGFDTDEVDSFLLVIAAQWQEMVDELRRSGEKIKEQELKLDHYFKVEEALQDALQTARSSARQTIENAERKATGLVADAEDRVVQIQKDTDMERLQVKRDTARYSVRRQEIVAKLRSFLMSEMEILSHFDAETSGPTIMASKPRKEIELVRGEDEVTEGPESADDRVENSREEEHESDDVNSENDEAEDIEYSEPSWRVNPIFESSEDSVQDSSVDQNSENENPESSQENGDDADEEIRKIHQILKNLDEEHS